MIPDGFASLLLFLLVVVPGLLFELLARRRRAGETESAFRETSRVAFTSCIFTGLSLGVLAAVRALHPSWMPNPRQLLVLHNRAYLADHYRLIARALLLEIGLACLLVVFSHLVLARRDGSGIRSYSAWATAFRLWRPREHDTHARVRLANGTVYTGRVGPYSPEPQLQDRELMLIPPLTVTPARADPQELPAAFKAVILRGSAIEVISVFYKPRSDERSIRAPKRVSLGRLQLVLRPATGRSRLKATWHQLNKRLAAAPAAVLISSATMAFASLGVVTAFARGPIALLWLAPACVGAGVDRLMSGDWVWSARSVGE